MIKRIINSKPIKTFIVISFYAGAAIGCLYCLIYDGNKLVEMINGSYSNATLLNIFGLTFSIFLLDAIIDFVIGSSVFYKILIVVSLFVKGFTVSFLSYGWINYYGFSFLRFSVCILPQMIYYLIAEYNYLSFISDNHSEIINRNGAAVKRYLSNAVIKLLLMMPCVAYTAISFVYLNNLFK